MKKLTLVLIFLCTSNIYFQTDIIDVKTSGVGVSKEEATKNALRNALESSFGAFISTKTEIVNDEIINDEITSISTGNIVSYDVISELVDEENYYVTVNSKVSLVKFSRYMQSKGYDVSFNGKSFGMKLKLQEFNEKSEEIVMNNILEVFDAKLKKSVEFKLEVDSDPILVGKNSLGEEIFNLNIKIVWGLKKSSIS